MGRVWKHFHIPISRWKEVRNEFARALERLNRPVSAYEAVNDGVVQTAPGTRPHEIAAILREDKRFTDLGFLLFALAKWGIEERQLLRDLVPKVLEKAGKLLTARDLGEELRRFRSVSALTVANFKWPGVRDFGHGYFGLSHWGEDKLLPLLTDPIAIERAVRHAELPFTWSDLCTRFGISIDSQGANTLWKTCLSVPAVLRVPDECAQTTRLVPQTCRLERALAAALRSTGQSAAPYELQWTVNDLFGEKFRDVSVADIERCLKRTPAFLQEADGRFSLQPDVDDLDVDVEGLRSFCTTLLSSTNELLGCDELIDRLETAGRDVGDLTADILAVVLRKAPNIEEIGRNRFRYRP